MINIIEELFYGNISPGIRPFDRNSEYGKAMKIVSENEQKLLALLVGEEKGFFLDYTSAQITINSETAVEKFTYGFKLGALLMIEALSNHNGLLRGKYQKREKAAPRRSFFRRGAAYRFQDRSIGQQIVYPAGMASSTMIRCSFSSPSSCLTADSSIPFDCCPIIFLGARFVQASTVFPTSSCG